MSNPWIPIEMRYKAILYCPFNGFVRHAEVIRGRWRCETCKNSVYFEDNMDAETRKRLPNRTYVYNRTEGREEPKL